MLFTHFCAYYFAVVIRYFGTSNIYSVFKSLIRLYACSSATPVGCANEILVEQKSADGLSKG